MTTRSLFALSILVLLSAAAPSAQMTARVSLGASGVQGDLGSFGPALSGDGRFVVFASHATNLVPHDANGTEDVFLRDRLYHTTLLVSLGASGLQGNGESLQASVSADGRTVVFQSFATNLVPGDTNGAWDIFVRDMLLGTTRRVSVGPSGVQADGGSGYATISADGRRVAFQSSATNLVAGDTNGEPDVFVHDLVDGTTVRASLDSGGAERFAQSGDPALSGDGRYVAFDSSARLVPEDTNRDVDVYVRDLVSGTIVLASVDSAGVQADESAENPRLSADGRYVAFLSYANNLAPGDTNDFTDVFVHDLVGGSTVMATVATNGDHADALTTQFAFSADGRYVAFRTEADNLVPGDTNGVSDVFVHDLVLEHTERVSVASDGRQANGSGGPPAFSADGRSVAFSSDATDLVHGDTNGAVDVFVRSFGKVHHR
jgi:Tol biopolymer transport system component